MQPARDVVDVLTPDHTRIQDLLTSLRDAQGEEAREAMHALRSAVAVHIQVEEEIVYPAFRQCVGGGGDETVARSLTEHSLIDVVLEQMGDVQAGTATFRGKAAVLRGLVEQHMDHEEKEVFATLRDTCDEGLLRELGQDVADRIGQLEGHVDPSSWSP